MTNSRFAQLPCITVRWNQATITSGGTFVQYNVYRRLPPETAWTRIAVIASVSVTTYRDYAAAGHRTWEYAVTQVETIGIDTLESNFPSPVAGRVDFNWSYLHDVSDPTQFVPLYSFLIDENVQQDVQYHAAWGRTQPTAFVGDLDFSHLRISGLPDEFLGEVWDTLREMLSLQPSSAAVFCLRVGVSGQRYFVNASNAAKRGAQATYDPSIELTEVAFSEAV